MADLIPPDLAQCQAEKSNGVNFMTLGGHHAMERCKTKPVVIATETKPGKDGKHGSMSLCGSCWAAMNQARGRQLRHGAAHQHAGADPEGSRQKMIDSAGHIETFLRQMVEMQSKMQRPKDFAYGSIEEFVLTHGRAYEKCALTKDEHEYTFACAKRHGWFPIKQCFYNSQIMLLNADPKHRFTYVEGYATGLIPVQHGWLTINGKVLDFTMREWSKKIGPINVPGIGAGILGTWKEESREYFGVEFPRKLVLATVLSTGNGQSLLDDYMRGYPLLKKPWKQPRAEKRA